MAKVNFTSALQSEYQALFDTCQVNATKRNEVDRIATRLLASRHRYEEVGGELGIPWQVIAVIHTLECAQDFNLHLHNGDPLTARTVHVPKGRPADGEPPFEWAESAADALQLRKLPQWDDWSVAGMLYCLEGYNGWGYRLYHPEVKSPYLWGNSNHYTSGKYVKDGTWSSSAVSAQCGAATLLRRLAEKGAAVDERGRRPQFAYAPSKVTPRGAELQRFLNGFPGIYLREDGKLGEKSSNAFQQVFGHYLQGDPRA